MDLLSSTLGAVGQAGEALDKFTGGRALRGTLAGKPRELASVLPFSDTLGLTRPEDATSGRDLTDQYGLTKHGDNSFGSHAAGFLADNVLSPASMLGAYGAFKAAPTIARGLGQGAKALTGLDLLDHVAGGAKKLGGFLGGEAGSIRAPHISPNPINTEARTLNDAANNGSRPRRFSTDPGRQHFYANDRNARFVGHMTGGQKPTYGGPIGKFIGDDSGTAQIPHGLGDVGGADSAADLAHEEAMFGLPSEGEALGDEMFGTKPAADRDIEGLYGLTSKLNKSLKGFAGDESGYLRHAIPGVDPELANAMDGLGPQYPGGIEKLQGILGGAREKIQASSAPEYLGGIEKRLKNLISSPHAEGVASEIPEGSRYLGAGMEGITFRTPEGSVIRLGDLEGQSNRPDIPEMLQAFREHRVGPYKIEHMPQVAPVYQEFDDAIKDAGHGNYTPELADAVGANSRMNDLHDESAYHLANSVRSRLMNPWDVTSWNTGMTPEGNAIIFDGGAVAPPVRLPGDVPDSRLAPKPTYDAPRGDMLQRALSSGGPERVRESLRQGVHMGTVGQGIMTPQMNQIAQEREAIQGFLRQHGIDPGIVAGWRGDTPVPAPQYAEAAQGGAPSLGMLLGTMGATAGAGGLLAYLMSGSHGNGSP